VGTSRDPEAVMASIGDPVGYLYRFTHPVSTLGEKHLSETMEETP